MKKRRVLALFLALSMALSSNGFTALAAEQDPAASIEADLSEATDETNGESVESDANDENENNASENEDDAQDNAGENGDTSEGGSDVSEDGNTSENNGETGDDNVSSDENGNAEDGSTESDGTDENEDDALSEDDGEDGSDVDASDEAEPEKDVQIVDEGLENTGRTEVRMYTFTDETGMAVTYDLNEESTYVYTVVNHVLTNVTKASGEKLSGTVELKQRTNDVDDQQYYTEIDASVFSENNNEIEYVILPGGVKIIGSGAFQNCEKLKGISLPLSLTTIDNNAFKNCKKLTQLSIPKSVESIGVSAFENDSRLFMVYIKDSAYSKMKRIGANAFKECRSLEKFGSDTEFVLPGYLESIGEYAFEECRSIKKVTLPDTVKEKKNTDGTIIASEVLGKCAFRNCVKMTDLVLSGVSVIPEEAFKGCENLISVKFENGNKEIRTSAFEGCAILSEVVLPSSISTIWDNAFKNCGKLSYVDIQNPSVEFKYVTISETGEPEVVDANDSNTITILSVFPTNHEVWIKANLIKDSSLAIYLETHSNNIKLVSDAATKSALFKCEYLCLTTVSATSVVFTEADKTTHISSKGVKAGTKIYVFINRPSSVKLIEGSLRCNGTPIGKDSDGEYTFNMPVGGAYVTAEYEGSVNGVSNNINGYADDVEFDLSNGDEIRDEASKVSKSFVLKVGQTTRMFLIDNSAGADGSVIDSSKIKFETDDKKIATVSKDGVIKALKKGTARITATVNDRNGTPTSRQAVIKISSADVLSLKLKPVSYDSSIINVDTQMESENGEEKVLGVSVSKNYVESKETTFTLLATAYDSTDSSGDNMSAALKWKSSDSKVAKLAKSSTTEAESENTITIPAGAKGDATITVTATNANPADADYKTVVAKFSVHVLDNTPRIASSSLVLNPYQKTGAEFEIVGAYGNINISNAQIEIRKYSDTTAPSAEFILTADKNETVSSVRRCHIRSIIDELKDGAYKESIHIEIGGSVYDIPITVNVKRFKPDPKVKFAKNQAKINLFYANDATEVVPVISNLGNTKIESYSLENLSNGVDDLHFAGNGSDIVGNFQIDDETGIITRLSDNMYYTSKKKPVVTGYLVLTFKDFKEGYDKKRYKITIPTKTTKPSYKLERSSDTFSLIAGQQDGVTLALLDSKTKKQIDLNDGDWEVTMDSTSTSSAVASSSVDTTVDGKITMDVNPNGGGGIIVLAVRNNDTWDEGQVLKYKYKIKISSKKPTFKLSKSTVSMSRYFATEQTEKVSIKSNQCGVEAGNPNFEPQNYEKLSEAKKEQYSLIDVGQWNPDTKEVSVTLLDSDIKTGTYKFVGYPYGDNGNKVTLTVKVTGTVPALSIKGSASLNRSADNADTATLTLNIKNCPSDCKIDADSTSTIECVTNKESEEGIESEFDWTIEDNKLKISLQKDAEVYNKTYTFKMTPKYTIGDSDKSKPVKFKVKVYQKAISVSLKAKGKINLLERNDESIANATPTPTPTPNMSAASDMIAPAASNDALMIDTKAVVSYSNDDDPTDDPTDNPDNNDPTTSSAVDVKYEYLDSNIQSVTIKSGTGSENPISENDTVGVDSSTKELKEVLTITATANGDSKITSIKAYNTGDKNDETVWTNAEAILSGTVKDEGASAELIIPADTTLTDAGITIVIGSEKKAIEHTVTLTKPAEGATLGYAVIDADVSVEDSTNFDEVPASGEVKIADGKKLAVEVTPSSGFEIKSVSASMGESGSEESLKISEVVGKENVYITDPITADASVTITVEADDVNGKTVTYVQKGGKTTIKKSVDGNIITDGGVDTTTAEDYAFVVKTENGYNADVKVYKTSEYGDGTNLESVTPISATTSDEADGSIKYTIANAAITEAITIVVTDIYTIVINNIANTVVTGTDYSIGDAEYSNDPNPTAKYGEKLALRLIVDTNKLNAGESIVVKYAKVSGTSQLLSRKETDTEGNVYNYDIGEVTDNIQITISMAEAHQVTLPKTLQKGVSGISYYVIESGANIESGTVFKEYVASEAATPIPVTSGYKLALKITPEENYTITSVKNTVADPEAAELKKVTVGEETVYVLDNVEADAVIAIEAAKVNTAKFVKHGGHATIKQVGDDAPEIPNNGTDTFVSGENYQFVVETQPGYGVDVKAYKKADYDSAIADNKLPNDAIEPAQEGNTYTISKGAIDADTEEIVIVITDIYTVNITNDAGVSAVKYRIGDAAGFTGYDSTNKPTVLNGKAVSLSFTQAEGANIVVMNGDKQMSPDSSSTAENPIYSINAVEDNVNITISIAYEIDEDILKNYNDNLTAQIVYDPSVKTDAAGKHIILKGNDLSFTVKLNKGYDISEVGYRLTAAESDTVTPLTPTGNEYTISALDVTANVTIVVKTQEKDTENWIVEFDVTGAKVQTGTAAASPTPEPIQIARSLTGEARTIKFNVEKIEGNKLRYVGTDETGQTGKWEPLDNDGNYQYTLPASPEPVTTIYVKATPLAQNRITFTGLTENSITKATASMVTFSPDNIPDNTAIMTTVVDGSGVAAGTYEEDTKAYFMITPTAGYLEPVVKVNETALVPKTYTVKVNAEETARQVSIYTLDLANVTEDVTIEVTVPSASQEDDEEPSYGYTLTNSIVYTPVVSNLKDTIIDAKIFDAAGAAPDIEKSDESDYFNIGVDVKKGLLYVTPKPDLSEETYLRNNTTYSVKIWLQFEKYRPEANGGGVWVDKIIKIKTGQVLPKVTTDTKTINLYQSNTEYEASFNVSLKGNTNAVVTGISFGDKDQRAEEAFEVSDPIKQPDGSYRFTIKLSGQALYANNSTNKIKMYVQFENQAKDTLGTPFTMNIRING